MSVTPTEKPKRLSILEYKGTKSAFPENKNKTDSDIFGIKQLRTNKIIEERTTNVKKVAEANIDKDIRSKSPYFNGQKNSNYVAPHFESNIGFSSNYDKPYMKKISTTPTANRKVNAKYNIFNQEVEDRKPAAQKVEDDDVPNFGRRKLKNNLSNLSNLSNVSRNEHSFDMVELAKFQRNEKSKTIEANNDENLVCDYCVNDKMKKGVIKKKEKELEEENVIMSKIQESQKFEDKMRNEKQKLIKDTIKKRENMTTLASVSIANGREKEKNRLQKQNEKETFILHDRKKVNKEILIANEKSKQKEIIQEEYLTKYMKSVRPEVGEYFEKYVE
jgi:hypothetical protein